MRARYVGTHERIVRGRRHYKTLEEKRSELLGLEKEEEALQERAIREEVEAKFLVPDVRNYVETEEVRRIKNRVKMWNKVGYPPHIVGPTGCGKTTLALQVAKEFGRPVTWINGDEAVTTTDLVGGYSEKEVESVRDRFVHNVMIAKDRTFWKWVDNPLTLACKYGYTLVYNEFSRTKPEANNVLLSVLEEGILELPTKFGEERYIDVHPDFSAIFTSNSIEYAGVHRPQDALLDRMVDIYMDYYDFDTEVKIVLAHTGVQPHYAERVVKLVRGLREELPEVEKPGTRAEIMICYGLNAIDGYSEEAFRQICLDVLATKIGGSQNYLERCALIKKMIDTN